MRLLLFFICFIQVLAACHENRPAALPQLVPFDSLRLDSTILSMTTIADSLEVPWELAWGPENRLWYTEQNGKISSVDPETGKHTLLLQLPDSYRKRLGLVSMVLAPEFNRQSWVFLNYLFLKNDKVHAKLVRYTYEKDTLVNPFVLLEWPAHAGHNGSRMAVSPDGKLMLATGDIMQDSTAQDPQTLHGKIIRLNMDGSIPLDNPFPGSAVWSLGFRVPQGLVYSSSGNLYSAEHGDATDDEVNLILPGGNYGWPAVTGVLDTEAEHAFHQKYPVTPPLRAWTPTIAPAAMTYYKHTAIPEWNNHLLLVTLKSQTMRLLALNESGDQIIKERVYLEKRLGRLRAACVSPVGDVYIATSNRDWNPPEQFPIAGDDRIIRIQAVGKIPRATRIVNLDTTSLVLHQNDGKALYNSYCVSCHRSDGRGKEGSFPALAGSPLVIGNIGALIELVNNGSRSKQMPAFSFLTDSAMAAILTYIRTDLNKSDGVLPDTVRIYKKKYESNK